MKAEQVETRHPPNLARWPNQYRGLSGPPGVVGNGVCRGIYRRRQGQWKPGGRIGLPRIQHHRQDCQAHRAGGKGGSGYPLRSPCWRAARRCSCTVIIPGPDPDTPRRRFGDIETARARFRARATPDRGLCLPFCPGRLSQPVFGRKAGPETALRRNGCLGGTRVEEPDLAWLCHRSISRGSSRSSSSRPGPAIAALFPDPA